MATLDLKQIADKLNSEFNGETRKLVFWYDAKGEFEEEISELELDHAKVYRLEKDNLFYTKYFLEKENPTTSYLIYAPFPRPPIKENHLADMLCYSKEFFADRASLLCVDLGIPEGCKAVIERYFKFFGAKDRIQKFYDLELDTYTEDIIEKAIMSIICKLKTASFEEVMRVVLSDCLSEDNKYIIEFKKYGLMKAFWRLCEVYFGYEEAEPTLEKCVMALFVTYLDKSINEELPKAWKSYVSFKSGNIKHFLENLMNNVLYQEQYNALARQMSEMLQLEKYIKAMKIESLIECEAFKEVDQMLIAWITERLLNEDIGRMLEGRNLVTLCEERMKTHFGLAYQKVYQLLKAAYTLIATLPYQPQSSVEAITAYYTEKGYKVDEAYRKFYLYYDAIECGEKIEQLRQLIENIYTNEYLEKITTTWNEALQNQELDHEIPLQLEFYRHHISLKKERTVVIISDALRYEVGNALFRKLQNDEKCTATIEPMLSVLPSYTKLGMAALLPHRTLEMKDVEKVLVDGKPSDTTDQRQEILRAYEPNSRCVQYKDICNLNVSGLREIFQEQSVIYIYHNQIDARGDKAISEHEVFKACEDAIDEIYRLIRRLTESVSAVRYIVTADHGFIYKRDAITESDKIEGKNLTEDKIHRRFIVSEEDIHGVGTVSYPMCKILKEEDAKHVIVPIASQVFKASGGANYVHGGASVQEMLVPIIHVKTQKGHVETENVKIALISMTQKVTSLISTLEFIQSEAVNDHFKATSYKLYFVSEEGERISNEVVYVADKKDKEPGKRIFRLKFNFKNIKYDRTKKYQLVVYDQNSKIEEPIWTHDVVMDLVFSNDFGF